MSGGRQVPALQTLLQQSLGRAAQEPKLAMHVPTPSPSGVHTFETRLQLKAFPCESEPVLQQLGPESNEQLWPFVKQDNPPGGVDDVHAMNSRPWAQALPL
jgi:hypothetical protein